MRRTNRLLLATAVFLAGYLLMLLAVNRQGAFQEEVFPLFSWDLFSRVPSATMSDYDIRFVEMNGNPVEPPVYFSENPYVSDRRSSVALLVIRRFGGAVDRGNERLAEEQKSLLDDQFLKDLDTARYEVVRRRYDIRRRVECHCFEDEVVVAEFTHG